MHVGNLRTALYAYLIAKHEGGDFILRIEDTDQERYVEGALDIIYHTLKETGLVHDEGPDLDGGVGPYVQSERQAQGGGHQRHGAAAVGIGHKTFLQSGQMDSDPVCADRRHLCRKFHSRLQFAVRCRTIAPLIV